jgi:hypothetical protein
MSRLALALAVVNLLLACETQKVQPLTAALTVDAGEVPQGKLYPSRRCGECHGRQRDEWASSAHARSASGVYKVASQPLPEEAQARCARCHVPLEAAGPRVASDGVGCDACHTATGGKPGGPPLLSPQLATRFGPYRDAKDHHFHRVAYSGFIDGNALCAVCHEDAPGGAFGIYTTVSEAEVDPNAPDCASCHMTAFTAIAAKGEKQRVVARHDFKGDRKRALAEAIALQVSVGKTEAIVALTNTGASHALPTGRPERRLRLEVEWVGKAGNPLGTEERLFGRVLADGDGGLAPSFHATQQLSDDRLVRGQARREQFALPPGASKLMLRLWYEPFDRKLQPFFGPSESLLIVERVEAL